MGTKLEKGTYGYLDRNRRYAWRKTILMLTIPILIFLAAWMIHGTRENVMTVVAVVGCLPGCNQMVRAILAGRYRSIDQGFQENVEAVRGNRLVLYENVFTSYERNYYVDCMVISGRTVAGYSSDQKLDPGKAAAHVRTMLKNSAYKQNVEILKDSQAFLKRVEQMALEEPEEVPFQGDDRYPGWTREEIIRHLLSAFSL